MKHKKESNYTCSLPKEKSNCTPELYTQFTLNVNCVFSTGLYQLKGDYKNRYLHFLRFMYHTQKVCCIFLLHCKTSAKNTSTTFLCTATFLLSTSISGHSIKPVYFLQDFLFLNTSFLCFLFLLAFLLTKYQK